MHCYILLSIVRFINFGIHTRLLIISLNSIMVFKVPSSWISNHGTKFNQGTKFTDIKKKMAESVGDVSLGDLGAATGAIGGESSGSAATLPSSSSSNLASDEAWWEQAQHLSQQELE
jgi:hypothetical protein